MKTLLFILLSSFFIVLFAQDENPTKEGLRLAHARYYQDFLNFASDKKGITRVDIFIQVPYNEVVFVKKGNDFESNYTVTITVYDEKKEKVIVEKSWNENIKVTEFSTTSSKTNSNLSMRSFELPPAKYIFRTSVEDKESKKNYLSENVFTVRDLSQPLAISDVMLIAKKTITETGNKILPNISRNVNAQKDGVPMFFEIYSDSARDIELQFAINEGEKDAVEKDTLIRNIQAGRTQVFHTITTNELSLGSYLVTVKLLDKNKNVVSTTIKSFVSRWSGLPSTIKDLDKAIAQLVYIATPSEKKEIENAPSKEEKIKRYQDFWKKKDPVPTTEENEVFDEYYRRINYANENFTHYVEGWKTDRGMVYILLSAPNNIERHPFDFDSKPYEIWEYYELNKSFVFVDDTGFGDYKLTTPLYGDLFRYRY